MIKPINKNTLILSQSSVPATTADTQIVTDLVATLQAHQTKAVGMAANMIGELKRIIAVFVGPIVVPMINPRIVSKNEPYTTTEGCLSLTGQRETTRYQQITVNYQDTSFKPQRQTFTGFTAEIIQHEIDHCDGILI